MIIRVFDTETTSLDKPFCYNIGYTLIDTDTWKPVLERDCVVEQVWHNLPHIMLINALCTFSVCAPIKPQWTSSAISVSR